MLVGPPGSPPGPELLESSVTLGILHYGPGPMSGNDPALQPTHRSR